MISISLLIGGVEKQIPFPEDWNELTTPELRYCMRTISDPFCKVKIFTYLMQSRAKTNGIKLPEGWQSRLNIDQSSVLCIDALAFLFDSNTLTKSPFKSLRAGNFLLYGPADDFDDFTCGQFELAMPSLHRFKETENAKYLFEMCSYFFKKNNQPVTEQSSAEILPLMAKTPTDILLCMYSWFTGNLSRLPLMFPNIYAGSSESDEVDYTAFTKLIHAGAGDRNGTRQQIRLMPLKEYLFDMELLEIAAQKQKEANAKD